MKKKYRIVLIVIACLLTGCRDMREFEAGETLQETSEYAAGMQTFAVQKETVRPETEVIEENIDKTRKGSGSITYEKNVEPLEKEQEQLLMEYISLYYEALATLKPLDVGHLFSDSLQAEASEGGAALQVELRKMQEADYSLVSYSFTLRCSERNDQDNGSVELVVREDSIQKFKQMPEVDAERLGGYHRFTLEQSEGKWKIKNHMMFDSLSLELFRNHESGNLAETYIQELSDYLRAAAKEFATRKQQKGEEAAIYTADHEYNREEAVAYAMQYVGERNSEWPDYTGHGGNCQNYASQCLLAGGIPMDITGEAVWKWYGSEVSNRAGSEGRSSSWTGVAAFISYARDNTGNGLVAELDAAYYKGEPGDLIHMGTEEGWRHTVMITGVIRNEKGEVLDYLVHSNTADIKEFPASLYGYPKQMLTKIYGWNG